MFESSNHDPVRPDGRYLAARGWLWRKTDPSLPDLQCRRLTAELMAARRAFGAARKQADRHALVAAHAAAGVVAGRCAQLPPFHGAQRHHPTQPVNVTV